MDARIVIIPPKAVADYSGRLASVYAAKFSHDYAVDNKKFMPHITVTNRRVSKIDLNVLKSELGKAVKRISSFSLKIDGLSNSRSGVLGLSIVTTRQLLNLHRAMRKLLSSPGTKIYRPHITLVKLKNTTLAAKLKQGRVVKKRFTAQTIALCSADKFGQINKTGGKFRVLKTYRLQ